MSNRYAIVLAAGQGTRMKSKLYKVLHQVCGKPMVQHVVDQVKGLQPEEVVAIIGHGAEMVREQLGDSCQYAIQDQQLGTAHAVLQAEQILAGKQGTTLVICGDTPLIKAETMEALVSIHEEARAKATILTARAEEPDGYGRVIRDDAGRVQKIVEHKDADEIERQVKEINTGTYCFDNQALFQALKSVSNNNAQGEYYLPDVIEILKAQGETVTAYQTDDFEETMGVNDRAALAEAERIMRKRINRGLMLQGVTMIDPSSVYADADVKIGPDTVVYPGTIIRGDSEIGSGCMIGPNTELTNVRIGDDTVIKQSVAEDSSIGSDVKIGPFAHIRPQSDIKDEVKIGNFVEIKKAVFGKASKASHLSYIGDSEVGEDVNIGCGSITVNYDGKNKYQTKIGNRVFVGCNSNLVAPVSIGDGAYIAAGSTITEDVPGEALAIARARQTNKEDYVKRLKFNN